MSDDEYCFYDDDFDYFDSDDDDDDDDLDLDSYYDDEFDDCNIYVTGSLDHDEMDNDYPSKSNQINPADQDRKAIYKELLLPDPNDLLKNPCSLMDICSLKVALRFPFGHIEDRVPPIPENIQLKIIKHSFPRSMEKIKRYCVLNNGSSTEFERAIRIVKSVKDMKQIGFHLSANIEVRGYRDMWYGPPGKKSPNLYVTIKFDRGKITETHCPCEMSSSWCYHVIAVCLARIFKHDDCLFKPPLSDSLNNLSNYAQLRTFTQYLIAEFCDGRIIESAQNVLDRMLTPRSEENDAIDQIWGAPDPTAGPGVDEDSQWLICEEGLKSRCTTLIRNTEVTEGCWGLNISEIGPSSSVMEWWKNFQFDKPVVADYFCDFSDVANSGNSSFSYNYYRHSYSREKSQEISKFLTTCEELVRDDYSYSLKAVKTFTLQLIDVLKERNQRDVYRFDTKVYESNSHLGCVPRPQRCWLFRDQLARLWRLLLLSPEVTEKQRQEIFSTLDALDTKITTTTTISGGAGGAGAASKKEQLKWDSHKHIRQLKDFSWQSLELGEDPFKCSSLAEVTIDHCVVMETQKVNPPTEILAERFSYPVSLKCGSFCSSLTVYSYMVEALIVYGKLEQAVHLAMALALSIVRYYNSWLDGALRVTVKETLYVDWDEDGDVKEPANTTKRGKRGKRCSRKRGRKGAAKDKLERSPKEAVFHEETGVIPVTSLAYLLHVLQENVDLLAEMLKLVKVQHRGDGDEDMEDDVTSDAHSLIFRLGVVGLAIPKTQAPSLQMQVEWFNWEAYIADKMAKSVVTDYDLVFLRKMTCRLSNLSSVGAQPYGFIPPYAVVMTLFTHLYKPSPAGKVSEACVDALNVALKTIETSPEQVLGVSMPKRMFFESCRRHWVKLVETVIYAVSNRSDYLKQVLQSIFVSVTMIGSPSNNVSVTSRAGGSKATSEQKAALIYHMIPEKVIAALYLSHSLVERADRIRLSEQTIPSSPAKQAVCPLPSGCKERKAYETLVVHGRKMLVKELPMCDQRRLLYETAIKVGTYAYAVKNNAFDRLKLESYSVEYNFPDFLQRNLRWLCRLSNKIDVKAFDLILERHQSAQYVKCFNDDEIVRLCTQMLESEQKREDRVWLMVKDVLLILLKGGNEKKINDILELCRSVERDRSKPAKRALLFPAICKELLNYLPTTALSHNLKLDYLTRAMKIMQTLFKDTEAGDMQDNLNGLKELFADSSVSSADKPGTSKERVPQQPLDRNLQLSFDLCLAAVQYLDENDKVRGYESRRRCESTCEVVVFVAQKACQKQGENPSPTPGNSRDNFPAYEEVYLSRFIEVLCNTVKDCLLLTDFFFELSSRLLVIPQHGSFGRDKVLLSDDCKVAKLCQSCTSLLVLLKRCIAGLSEATHGDTMKAYLKETNQDTKSYLKTRAKHSKFYYGSSLVSVLDVMKRLMNLTEGDEDFETLSYKLAAKHAVTKAAVEELSTRGSSSSPRTYEDSMVPEELLSSLLLRRMFSPTLAGFEYDSDEWRY